MYFIAYPRVKRFWPDRLTQSAGTKDTLDSSFYTQLEKPLLESIKECLKSGSISASTSPDSFYLCRFQDRTIWIQIIESGYSYCIVKIKGLELQETSCHTREAQYIDDVLESAFGDPNGAEGNSEKGSRCLRSNQNFFNCMKPCDLMIVQAYSDAKNSTVGILDNKDTVKFICEYFPKVVHYLMMKRILFMSKRSAKKPPVVLLSARLNDSGERPVLSGNTTKMTSLKSEYDEKKPAVRSNGLLQSTDLKEWSDNDSLNDSKGRGDNNMLKQPQTSSVKSLPDINTPKVSKKINLPDLPEWFSDEKLFDEDNNGEEHEDYYDNLFTDDKKKAKKEENMKKEGNANKNEDNEKPAKNFNEFFFSNPVFKNDEMMKPSKKPEDFMWSAKSEDFVEDDDDKYSSSILKVPIEWKHFLQEVRLSKEHRTEMKELKNVIASKEWIELIVQRCESHCPKEMVDEFVSTLNESHFKVLLKCVSLLGKNWEFFFKMFI